MLKSTYNEVWSMLDAADADLIADRRLFAKSLEAYASMIRDGASEGVAKAMEDHAAFVRRLANSRQRRIDDRKAATAA